MTAISAFEDVISVDFEFISVPGEPPDVICVAWSEARSGRTFRLWRDELSDVPPYRIDANVLFVCFVANAELACHLALGWPLPANVLDLNPVFRCLVNGRYVPEGRGLLGALAYFHLSAGGNKRKAELQRRCAQGWPFTEQEKAEILLYCASDVEALVKLTPKMLEHIDLNTALHWGEFVSACARMERRGVPIDMQMFPRLTDKEAWRAVRDELVPVVDAAYGVYTKDKHGDWHFDMDLFKQFLDREGILWPVTDKGTLSTKRKTFENMTKGHPQLEPLRQLRHARDKMRRIKLAVGSDGCNRSVLWPHKSKTSRTQPKASEWIFSPAVWLRSLIKPAPGMAVAYVDWSSMEFMVAASLSGDPVMIAFYQSGDPYLSFAKRVGAVPATATKRTHGELRDRYKIGLLAIQYGIQAEGLAGRLGVSVFEAHEMILQHHELFAVYWQWSRDWLARALDTGTMMTALGWECRTGDTEFGSRSLINWPVQAAGADILRIAVAWATRLGLGLCAPVHDAILIESHIERIEADVALMQEIMRRASRVVLNPAAGGMLELRTDATIVRHPDRYTDKRGEAIWAHVLELLDRHEQQQAAAEWRKSHERS